jgi:hypothetical protein
MPEVVTEKVPPTKLTVVYQTCRREPMAQWFFDSLNRECGGDYSNIKIVVVDFWCQYEPERTQSYYAKFWYSVPVIVPPMGNVWQGKERLTKDEYFAAANSRNTGICHALDGYIAFVDDISVLMPGWLNQIHEAMAGHWIACGAYRKVNKLVVENGEVKSLENHPSGWDCRWRGGIPMTPQPCGGGDMFGCSIAAPVEAFLGINGFDTDVDSMSGEDYIAGIMLAQAGWHLKYCRKMLTFESEELHHVEPPLRRIIKKHVPGRSNFGEKDASHAILNMVRGGRRTAPNYYGPGGLRAVRERVLAGEPMPVLRVPDRDWRDGQSLVGMGKDNDGCP